MKKPNVLLVYPDQMRYDSMNRTGNATIKTPGLNRLCDEGVHFSNAYTSFPLCCPFRASLMTGKYATSHGMMANHYPLSLDQEFLPQIMREHGYETAWIGKWHLNGGPKHDFVPQEYRLGFEHFIGFSRGHEYLTPIYYRDDDTTPYKSDMFEPDLQTYHLLDFIDDNCSDDRPFFAAIGYGVPHPPLQLMPDHYKNLCSIDEIPDDPMVSDADKAKAKSFMAKYNGMIANVDYKIQRIINHLEYLDILDDTIFILVSDHGEMAYEHGLEGKKVFYEASMHVPFIIRYPKLATPHTESHIVDPSVSIMPTILDLCGIDCKPIMDGSSLGQLIKLGEDKSLPNHVFYQIPIEKEGPEKHPLAERGIRTLDELYIEIDQKPTYLFDLRADPHEEHNCIGQPTYSEKVKELSSKLKQIMLQFHDHWDLEMNFPPPNFQSHEAGTVYNKIIYQKAIYERGHY